MQKLVKIILTQHSYNWLAENQKAFRYFKKSDYWQSIKEDLLEFGRNSTQLKENIADYAAKFSQETKFLNLF